MTRIRRHDAAGLLFAIERKDIKALILHPEAFLELQAQAIGVLLQLLCPRAII